MALKAYGLLSGQEDRGHFGGAEVQQVLIARELASRGYDVSFVTYDHGQPDGVEFGGIRVFKAYSPHEGTPGLRFFHPRWSGLRRAMRKANARVYYQRNNGVETGQVALFCQSRGRRFVFAGASMTNSRSDLPGLSTRRERWFYRYGLRRADLVVAQTWKQQSQFWENFGVESVLIRSCCPDAIVGMNEQPGPTPSIPPLILWVGRLSSVKRVGMVAELATRCRDAIFTVVGIDESGFRKTSRMIDALPPNLRIAGRLPYTQIADRYRNAAALLCTSQIEGFPNTFLEAWAHGVPIITTVDPDGLVASSRSGIVADTIESLAEGIQRLLADPVALRELGLNGHEHFLRTHTIRRIGDEYERHLVPLLTDAVSPEPTVCH